MNCRKATVRTVPSQGGPARRADSTNHNNVPCVFPPGTLSPAFYPEEARQLARQVIRPSQALVLISNSDMTAKIIGRSRSPFLPKVPFTTSVRPPRPSVYLSIIVIKVLSENVD